MLPGSTEYSYDGIPAHAETCPLSPSQNVITERPDQRLSEAAEIVDGILAATRHAYSPLVLLASDSPGAASALLDHLGDLRTTPVVNLSSALAAALVELKPRARVREVPAAVEAIAAGATAAWALLDHIELLFEPSLRRDTVAVLEQVSRRVPLLVAWPGEWDGRELRYAPVHHPEHMPPRRLDGIRVVRVGPNYCIDTGAEIA